MNRKRGTSSLHRPTEQSINVNVPTNRLCRSMKAGIRVLHRLSSSCVTRTFAKALLKQKKNHLRPSTFACNIQPVESPSYYNHGMRHIPYHEFALCENPRLNRDKTSTAYLCHLFQELGPNMVHRCEDRFRGARPRDRPVAAGAIERRLAFPGGSPRSKRLCFNRETLALR